LNIRSTLITLMFRFTNIADNIERLVTIKSNKLVEVRRYEFSPFMNNPKAIIFKNISMAKILVLKLSRTCNTFLRFPFGSLSGLSVAS
jgi:hypothetical protein